MGADNTWSGRVTITPPLTWQECKVSPGVEDVKLVIHEEDGPDGRILTAVAIIPARPSDSWSAGTGQELQFLIDSHPKHEFAGSQRIEFGRGQSVLRVLERFGNLGGTQTQLAVSTHYRAHDRVVIVTDEQAYGSAFGIGGDVTAAVPASVPVYTWNLAGYRYGHAPSDSRNRHTFAGLTDHAFRMIPLLEAGKNGDWPF